MTIDISIGKVSLIDDEIVKLEFIPGVKINLEQAKDIYRARVQLKTKKTKQLLLADFSTGPVPDIEARNYAKSDDVTSITYAMAIVTGSSVGKILGNFFIGLNKPKFPTKLFTREDVAKDWLKKYKSALISI